ARTTASSSPTATCSTCPRRRPRPRSACGAAPSSRASRAPSTGCAPSSRGARMAELERDLRGLSAYVQLPAERDLAPAVRARLAARRRRRGLRLLAVALAAAAAAIGIAFAVPPARAAILRFFGFEGTTIIRVDKLPPVARGPAASGEKVTLAQ